MQQIKEAMAAIHDAAKLANCRELPIVTLTFDTRGDRYRFEQTMMRLTDPMQGRLMREYRPMGEFELQGVVFKLAVRQVDAL